MNSNILIIKTDNAITEEEINLEKLTVEELMEEYKTDRMDFAKEIDIKYAVENFAENLNIDFLEIKHKEKTIACIINSKKVIEKVKEKEKSVKEQLKIMIDDRDANLYTISETAYPKTGPLFIIDNNSPVNIFELPFYISEADTFTVIQAFEYHF
jgi:hypothetical protein